jgi:3-oxoacyl-[acyl-carrier-protein] synthase-3
VSRAALGVGLRGIAVAFPETIRTNEYWREHYPELVARAADARLGRLWRDETESSDPFDVAMRAHLSDPFRGSVERRVLGAGETALTLEVRAARDAVQAAGLSMRDVDLLLVGSFRPDHIGVGNAAFLARELGTNAPALNLESACSSSLAALHTACGLVCAGFYRHVLCVTSCTYSRDLDDADSLAWFLADGAGALVVGPVEDDRGLEAFHTVSTTDTCDTWRFDLEIEAGEPRVRMRGAPDTGKILRASSTRYLRECVQHVLDGAGRRIDEIDLFVFNTPTAWFHEFATMALGIPPSKAIGTYPLYSNIGPALMPANLHHALVHGVAGPGDLVLLYAVGSVSTATAAVLRLSEVGLGPMPVRAASAGPAPAAQGV